MLMLEDDASVFNDFINILTENINEIIEYYARITIRNIREKYETEYNKIVNNNNNSINYKLTNENIQKIDYFYLKYVAKLSKFELNRYFDIFQLKPPKWCFKSKSKSYTQYKLYTKSNILYYYRQPKLFAVTTALVIPKTTIIYLLNCLPFNDNSDLYISNLLMNGCQINNYSTNKSNNNDINKIVRMKAFATCPSIVGEIGGKSAIFDRKEKKTFRPPGWYFGSNITRKTINQIYNTTNADLSQFDVVYT